MTILQVFHISPLIRLTLLLLYAALTFPLPRLAQITAAPVSPLVMGIALGIGGIFLYAILAEQVVVSEDGLTVTYPKWANWVLKRGWFLRWDQVKSLNPRWTGQGGIVYYFVSHAESGSPSAYLLPMRIAGFTQLLRWVEEKTGIDTRTVTPLAQPWMYFILLGCTLLLLAIDFWILWTVPDRLFFDL